MMSLIIVNTWRGLPFYAITLLAGLQTISPELYEAATIDGASAWHRFRYVTLPLLKPVIFIVTMFSVIFTFADFQLVYVLTRGGPANATHLFATYAFDVAMGGGQLGLGASIALAMLPPLALIIVAHGAVHEAEQIMMVERGGWRVRAAQAVAASRLLHDLHAVPVLLDGGHLAEAEQRAVQPQDHAADRLPSDARSITSTC